MIGIGQTEFSTGPNEIPVHTINITYALQPLNYDVKIDEHHSEYGWFDKVPDNCHEEMKKFINK